MQEAARERVAGRRARGGRGEDGREDGSGRERVRTERGEVVGERRAGRGEPQRGVGVGERGAEAAGRDVGRGPAGIGVAGTRVEVGLAAGVGPVAPRAVVAGERGGEVAAVRLGAARVEKFADRLGAGVADERVERRRPVEPHADARRLAHERLGGEPGVGGRHARRGGVRLGEALLDGDSSSDSESSGSIGEGRVAAERVRVGARGVLVAACGLERHRVRVDAFRRATPGGEEQSGEDNRNEAPRGGDRRHRSRGGR